MFGVLLVFGRHIKGKIVRAGLNVQRDMSQPSTPLTFFTFMVLLAPVTNWEPHSVTLAGYCYAMRLGMKVQIVTPYHVSCLQCYSIMICGNVTSVYPPLLSLYRYYHCLFLPLFVCLLNSGVVWINNQRITAAWSSVRPSQSTQTSS
jgi:hypothetical protein